MRYTMRYGALIAAALAAAAMPARADHDRPEIFTDIGTPPAAEDAVRTNVSTQLMIDRCSHFLTYLRTDAEGHILDYLHDYRGGFCLGWINASMVFLNMHSSAGAPVLGVCLPDGIHTFEVMQTFLDFAKAHPEELKFNPSFLIYWAMLDKYPCKQ